MMIVNRNITVGAFSTGFIGGFVSRFSILFEDFYVNNVTFNGNCPFLYMAANGASFYDTASLMTNVTLRNGVVENLFENGTIMTSVGTQYVAYPLFMGVDGPSIFRLSNFTASNVIFKCSFPLYLRII